MIATFAGLLIAGGTLTLAADRAAVQRPTLVAAPATVSGLTVPRVTGQAFVFAKGILQDGGFAWKVTGPVRGYAANRVVDQSPAPGTLVEDTGAPVILLRLGSNGAYVQQGTPENRSPYGGTAVRLLVKPSRT